MLAFDSTRSCPTCKDKAKVILDHSAGDLVCTTCGLVLEGGCLDESQEWRTFAVEGIEEGMRTSARQRGGDLLTSLDDSEFGLGECTSTTMTGTDAGAQRLQHAQRMAERTQTSPLDDMSRMIQRYSVKIRQLAKRLALSECIQERCIDLLKELARKRELHPRREMSWFCAIVYIACREERAGRTFREIAHAAAPIAEKQEDNFEKQITKKVTQLTKVLSDKVRYAHTPVIAPEELIPRFVSRLQLTTEVCKPATVVAQRAIQFKDLVRTNLHSAVVPSAIFIIARLMDVSVNLTFQDVAVESRVAERAVKEAYMAMQPCVSRLLPESFKCRLPLESLPELSLQTGRPR